MKSSNTVILLSIIYYVSFYPYDYYVLYFDRVNRNPTVLLWFNSCFIFYFYNIQYLFMNYSDNMRSVNSKVI